MVEPEKTIILELDASEIVPLMHVLQVFESDFSNAEKYYQEDLTPVANRVRGRLSELWEQFVRGAR